MGSTNRENSRPGQIGRRRNHLPWVTQQRPSPSEKTNARLRQEAQLLVLAGQDTTGTPIEVLFRSRCVSDLP